VVLPPGAQEAGVLEAGEGLVERAVGGELLGVVAVGEALGQREPVDLGRVAGDELVDGHGQDLGLEVEQLSGLPPHAADFIGRYLLVKGSCALRARSFDVLSADLVCPGRPSPWVPVVGGAANQWHVGGAGAGPPSGVPPVVVASASVAAPTVRPQVLVGGGSGNRWHVGVAGSGPPGGVRPVVVGGFGTECHASWPAAFIGGNNPRIPRAIASNDSLSPTGIDAQSRRVTSGHPARQARRDTGPVPTPYPPRFLTARPPRTRPDRQTSRNLPCLSRTLLALMVGAGLLALSVAVTLRRRSHA